MKKFIDAHLLVTQHRLSQSPLILAISSKDFIMSFLMKSRFDLLILRMMNLNSPTNFDLNRLAQMNHPQQSSNA